MYLVRQKTKNGVEPSGQKRGEAVKDFQRDFHIQMVKGLNQRFWSSQAGQRLKLRISVKFVEKVTLELKYVNIKTTVAINVKR